MRPQSGTRWHVSPASQPSSSSTSSSSARLAFAIDVRRCGIRIRTVNNCYVFGGGACWWFEPHLYLTNCAPTITSTTNHPPPVLFAQFSNVSPLVNSGSRLACVRPKCTRSCCECSVVSLSICPRSRSCRIEPAGISTLSTCAMRCY